MNNIGENVKSFWLREEDERFQGFRSTPTLPQQAKVVIIGGGIMGISCGYWLKKLGETDDVVLLEKNNGLSEGATGRNGGNLWPGSIIPSPELMEKYGLDQVKKVSEFEFENVELVHQFIREHPGTDQEIQLYHTGGLDLVQKEEEVQKLKKNLEILNSYGLGTDLEFWDEAKCKKETFSPFYKGGIYHKRTCQLWPAKLVGRIAKESVKRGLKVYTNVSVEGVERIQSGSNNTLKVVVRTKEGNILADYVVYTTNAYTSKIIPEFKEIIIPVRGQILATSPVTVFQWSASLAQYDYEYMLQRRSDRRIICGGMRWKSPSKEWNEDDDTTISPVVAEALRSFLIETFPLLKEQKDFKIEQEWTGIMGFSVDDLPLLGFLPNSNNELIVAGFTGHGMTRAFGAGKMIAEMVRGTFKPSNEIKPFKPDRFPQLAHVTSIKPSSTTTTVIQPQIPQAKL